MAKVVRDETRVGRVGASFWTDVAIVAVATSLAAAIRGSRSGLNSRIDRPRRMSGQWPWAGPGRFWLECRTVEEHS
jgi:hypothetical protein